jgi:AcrR family transcriptional regulator
VNKPIELADLQPTSVQDTKQRILDAAERLFMERGFSATSLREITAAAKVNLAAVNYHFGSKETLIEAVLMRRLQPLNELRLAELQALEARSREQRAPLEAILNVYVGAAFKLDSNPTAGGSVFLRLLGRAFTEPTEQVRSILQRQYSAVAERYKQAFMRALPRIPEDELVWRMQFLFGAISYTMAGTNVMQLVASCGLADADDHRAVTRRLVAFLAAGLKAPVPPKTNALPNRRSVK